MNLTTQIWIVNFFFLAPKIRGHFTSKRALNVVMQQFLIALKITLLYIEDILSFFFSQMNQPIGTEPHKTTCKRTTHTRYVESEPANDPTLGKGDENRDILPRAELSPSFYIKPLVLSIKHFNLKVI